MSALDDRLARVVAAEPPYERPIGFEPSLLPALAQLCDADAAPSIIDAAFVFGSDDIVPYAWAHLRESAMTTLLRRFGRDHVLGWARGETSGDELDVWNVVVGDTVDEAALRVRIETRGDRQAANLLARLIATVGDTDSIHSFCDTHPGRDLDTCAVRALADAASAKGAPLPPGWLDLAIDHQSDWVPVGRVAHLIPTIEAPEARRALAAAVAGRLAGEPWWLMALVAATVGHDAPAESVDELLTAEQPPEIWLGLIRELFAAPPAPTPDAAISRAHPFGAEFPDRGVVAPELIDEMLGRWGGSPAMAAPGEPDAVGDEPPRSRAPVAPNPTVVQERSESIVVDDRRLGIGLRADGATVRNALIRDALTEITVSIAPPGSADHQLPTAANIPFPSDERLTLPVTLFDESGAQSGELAVWPNPTSDADVTFEVVPTGDHYHATIVLYQEDGSTVIQAASLAVDVVADAAAEATATPTIQFVEVAASAIGAGTTGLTGSVVATDEQAVIGAPGVPIFATPTGAMQGVEPLLSRFRTTAANFAFTNDAAAVTPTLIAAARFGFNLRRQLQLDALGDLDRIQVVPLFPAAVFPLELVYDGEPPDLDAALCTNWTTAAADEPCPTCTDTTDTTTVCPLRFWGLTKVIEHHAPSRSERNPTDQQAPFVAREHRRAGTRLTPPRRALVAASVEVANALGVPPATDDTTPESRIAALTTLFTDVVDAADDFGACDVSLDWQSWQAAIAEHGPGLLIAMPHQAGDSVTIASLELGGVAETTIVERHVRRPGESPGPVVLLLGCDTSNAPNMLASFATDVRSYAPVVVATIGRVVAREAPHLAATLVRNLRSITEGDGDVGRAIVATRRQLLAESRLVGLQLIAHGDARWAFEADEPTPTDDPPSPTPPNRSPLRRRT